MPNAPWYKRLLSLRWRLAVVYSLLFSIFVALLSLFIYSTISQLLLRNAQATLPQRAQDLHTQLIQEVCDTSPARSLTSFLRQHTTNDIDMIYLLDAQGKVLASSNNSLLKQPFPYTGPKFFTSAVARLPYPFHKSSPGAQSSDGLLLPVQTPTNCLSPKQLPNYIAVLTSYKNERNALNDLLLMLVTASAFMIAAGALIISFLTGIMFSPLKQVTRATRALAEGNLQQRVPLRQGHGEIDTLAASFNRMADRIEQMFAAQQASERRSRRFVSDASHELRTPITSLRGFTEVLIRGAKDDPATAQRVLGLMKNEAERMTQLVNDLLTLARLDERHVPAPTELDLVAVTVECLQQAREQTPKGCRLSLELATQERLHIHANQEQIQQMLLILILNAFKYGCNSEQRRVVLRLDKKANHALIQVVDYGAGISSDDLPHVFDRFYRGENAHPSNSTPIPGTGLGLPIAIAIAHAYEGTLTVCSEPNQETVFTASFQCVE